MILFFVILNVSFILLTNRTR